MLNVKDLKINTSTA